MSEMGQPRKKRLQFTLRTFMYGVALLVIVMLSGREIYFWATSSPLDEAVAAFNYKFTPNSEAPLTEDEVIASIGSQITTLEQPVRSIYARIARTRRLPKGADLHLITGRTNEKGERRRCVDLFVMTGESSACGLRIRGNDEESM